MTIIEELPDDTRAKRRIDPRFRRNGGAFPGGKTEPLHIDTKDRGDQSSTEESGLQ